MYGTLQSYLIHMGHLKPKTKVPSTFVLEVPSTWMYKYL